MGFSNYRIHKWLESFGGAIWLSLHYDNPEVAGAYASELFAGSYLRQLGTLGQPSNRGLYVISDITFTGLPDSRITHLGGWDAQYNGNLEFSSELVNPLVAVAGSSKTFPAWTIAMSVD